MFDGDEMNIHTPASELSRTELELLSATEQNMIGSQASKPLVSIVQDALLSSYLMTKQNDEIPRSTFINILMKADNISFKHITHKLEMFEKITKKYGKEYPLYCGKSLFSMLLPDDFNYQHTNKSLSHEPVVKIEKGILYEGAVNKGQLKSNSNSLIQVLHKEYSNTRALEFANNVQFIANEYLLYHGFSVGIEDCVATKKEDISSAVLTSFIEAEHMEEITSNPVIREFKVNMTLSKAKDRGLKIAKEGLNPKNNFFDTVISGSKGDFFNITQITGLLGQQNITGKRVTEHISNGRRTLPHYPLNNQDKQLEYLAKGFIENSFFHGLTPQEFWFHAMSGREGITDTSMKTASSGYIQRKMIKIMEDLQIKYDNTVRNSVGSIIQFAYGNDNLDARKTVLGPGKKNLICDVSRLVEQLNNQYELEK